MSNQVQVRVGSEAVEGRASVERDHLGVAYYRIGGREYPMRSEPLCHVCQSHYRLEIEQRILDGAGWTAIVHGLPEQARSEISVDSIRRHAKRHLPYDLHVRREIIEQRAEELGRDVAGDGDLTDYLTFARLGVRHVMEQMARGEIKPTIRDGIRFASLLLKADEVAGSDVDHEIVTETFVVWANTMQRHLAPEQFQTIMREIGTSPIIKALIARTEGRVIDAEVVGES